MLLCDDVDATAAFYRNVLGFELRSELARAWAELQAGGTLLAMRTRSRPYDGASQPGAEVHLGFRVSPSDVDVCVEQLDALGIDLLEPVAEFEDFGHRA